MLKLNTIILSFLIVSCGSKSRGSENQRNNDKEENITTLYPPDCFDDKIKKREDIYGYWIESKNDTSKVIYYFDENYIKKCELLKTNNIIISNKIYNVEWFRNEEFSYELNNNKVIYYVFKFDYGEIKTMSFKENDQTIHLESLNHPSRNEELSFVKDKCNF